jgi:hypothetical protein
MDLLSGAVSGMNRAVNGAAGARGLGPAAVPAG